MSNAVDTIWATVGADSSNQKKELRPFSSVQFEKDEECLKWLNEVETLTKNDTEARHRELSDLLDMYKGMHFKEKAYTPRDQIRTQPQRASRIFVNQIYEIIEQIVARMTRFKPAIEVSPTNNEYNDRQAAKIADQVVKHLFYINDFPALLSKMERYCRIFGESLMYIYWDDNKGDLHPDWKRAKEEGKRVRLNVDGEDGEPLFIDKAVRVGDVCFDVLSPFDYLLDPVKSFEDCDWIIIYKDVYIERLKAEYPKLASKISGPRPSESQDGKDLANKIPSTKIRVGHFFHQRTGELDSGRYVKYVPGCILESAPHPYSHKSLPVARITDIDVPEELHGRSMIHNLKPLQIMLNNITELAYRNMAMASQVKWFMQKGTCQITRLGNAQTVVEYSGAVAPKLEVPQTIPPDMFNIRDVLKQDLQQISGVHGISRGEPPPGIRAGIALQFLEEQENQRGNGAIEKRYHLIKTAALHGLSLAGDFYEESDGRMLRIVGKNNQYTVKALESANLSGAYDVRVNNVSALPESKAGRIQTLIDLRQAFGEQAVPDKFIVNMLETAQPEQFYSHVTVNIQKAESENEDLLNGESIPDPQDFDDHFEHWLVHLKCIQSRSFVDDVPEKIKKAIYDHIEMHEMFMWGKAFGPKANKAYADRLATLESWPLFFDPPTIATREPLPEEQVAIGGGGLGGAVIPPQATDVLPLDIGEPAALKDPLFIPDQQIPEGILA